MVLRPAIRLSASYYLIWRNTDPGPFHAAALETKKDPTAPNDSSFNLYIAGVFDQRLRKAKNPGVSQGLEYPLV